MNDEPKKETIFAQGFYFDKPSDKAPEFVKGRLSIKVEEAITFLQTYKKVSGYVNLSLLKSKDGTKLYFTLDTWEPKPAESIDGPSLINKQSEPGETTSDGKEMPPF